MQSGIWDGHRALRLSRDSGILRALDCFYISVNRNSFRSFRPSPARVRRGLAIEQPFVFLRCLKESGTPTLILHWFFPPSPRQYTPMSPPHYIVLLWICTLAETFDHQHGQPD
ncbi:hypothetical protein LZ30DRAFT_106498 [Colletotrichum cereale]|nr:hypothetical protein LZ30DRAFT_106498 [Colletotrichum cereale]